MVSKSHGSSGSDRSQDQVPPRVVGKGRYTNSPPLTPGTAVPRQGDIEIQVGDVTLVVKQDEADRGGLDKYGSRSAPAYGAVGEPPIDDDPPPENRDVVEAAAVMDLLVDDPIPTWGPWRSEVVSSSAGYHRKESRLLRR